ncbi:MAG: hypothetical protein WC979_01685 [Candidatus Pacearchaeota archaeon]|jgi:hypothetical protein|nr:hypothetical protein [Clostridia bacterium]
MAKKEEPLCYQWKKGENYSQVDKLQSEQTIGDAAFLVFESGRLLNKNLVDEFLVQIPSLAEPLFAIGEVPVAQPPKQKKPSNKKVAAYDYPTEEELANSMKDGKYSMGTAKAIPHPDDMPPVQQVQQSRNDNFAGGLREDGDESMSHADFTQGISHDNLQSYRPPIENPLNAIIDKTKKVELEMNLTLKVKLPVLGFFDMLDDDFVNDNMDGLLNALINKIKQNDLDSQIKNNLIKIYNINTQEQCQQQQQKNITAEEKENN